MCSAGRSRCHGHLQHLRVTLSCSSCNIPVCSQHSQMLEPVSQSQQLAQQKPHDVPVSARRDQTVTATHGHAGK